MKRNNNNKSETIIFDELYYLNEKLYKVRQLFDTETNPTLIESLVYEEKALMIRIDYLHKKLKKEKAVSKISDC